MKERTCKNKMGEHCAIATLQHEREWPSGAAEPIEGKVEDYYFPVSACIIAVLDECSQFEEVFVDVPGWMAKCK
jgi:hypothetical protein